MSTRYNQHRGRVPSDSYAPGNAPTALELDHARKRRKARLRVHRRKSKPRAAP